MHLFWQKGQKIRSAERFKTSTILDARFRESYFKLKVNGQAVTSHIVQELCESRGGHPGLSVLTSLLVSVDVKLY